MPSPDRDGFIDPARVTPTGADHVTGVQPDASRRAGERDAPCAVCGLPLARHSGGMPNLCPIIPSYRAASAPPPERAAQDVEPLELGEPDKLAPGCPMCGSPHRAAPTLCADCSAPIGGEAKCFTVCESCWDTPVLATAPPRADGRAETVSDARVQEIASGLREEAMRLFGETVPLPDLEWSDDDPPIVLRFTLWVPLANGADIGTFAAHTFALHRWFVRNVSSTELKMLGLCVEPALRATPAANTEETT